MVSTSYDAKCNDGGFRDTILTGIGIGACVKACNMDETL
jgi:hypothetical protein